MLDLTIKVRTLSECETVIEKGLSTFIEVGNALLEIRDNRLYREFHSTFEDYCRERWGFNRAHAYRFIDAAETIKNLSPIGDILPATESQARPLSQLPPEQQREVWQQVVNSGEKITASLVQQEVDRIVNKPHVANNSGENEWYTPPVYVEAARRVMGSIDIDPASSEIANRTVRATKYYTAEENGLTKLWFGNVWMNPPYAQPLVTEFCNKLVEHYTIGRIEQACVLVNNATETAFFQNMLQACSAVCFIKSRIKFIDKNGNESGAPLQGQCVLYFGLDTERFKGYFKEFGVILYA